jgi:hypothetical protein
MRRGRFILTQCCGDREKPVVDHVALNVASATINRTLSVAVRHFYTQCQTRRDGSRRGLNRNATCACGIADDPRCQEWAQAPLDPIEWLKNCYRVAQKLLSSGSKTALESKKLVLNLEFGGASIFVDHAIWDPAKHDQSVDCVFGAIHRLR